MCGGGHGQRPARGSRGAAGCERHRRGQCLLAHEPDARANALFWCVPGWHARPNTRPPGRPNTPAFIHHFTASLHSKGRASNRNSQQRYYQSDKGQANKKERAQEPEQRAKRAKARRARRKAAKAASQAAEAAASPFLQQTQAQTHEQRVAAHFSAEDLAEAESKCSQSVGPFYLSSGTRVTNASASEPGFLTESLGWSVKGQEAIQQKTICKALARPRAGQRARPSSSSGSPTPASTSRAASSPSGVRSRACGSTRSGPSGRCGGCHKARSKGMPHIYEVSATPLTAGGLPAAAHLAA